MQPRTLNQIVSELRKAEKPRVKSLRKQQDLLRKGEVSQEEGLKARQTEAFGEILGGARRRGLGFSGIPLAEQARYTSTQFLPELARLRQSTQQGVLSLEDAINQIRQNTVGVAQQIRQQELDRAEAARQFNAQMATRGSSGGGGGFNLGGGLNLGAATKSGGLTTGSQRDPLAGLTNYQKNLADSMFYRGDGSAWDEQALRSDYARTKESAGYGNAYDKQKLMLYHRFRPDIFGRGVPSQAFDQRQMGVTF